MLHSIRRNLLVVTPRSATVLAILVSLVAGAPRASAALDAESDNIGSLRRAADKARAELASATKQWETRKKDLALSQQKLKSTLKDLGAADAQLNRIRWPLAELANAAYQGPGAAGSMVIFAEGSADQALRSAADTSHLADSKNTSVEQAGLQQQIDGLKRRSAELTQQLTAALDRLRVARDRRFALGCSATLVADARKYPNGLIPSRYLCKLPQKGSLLRADAARTFYRLNTAYKKRFGRDMCIRDAYRSLSEQQSVYAQRPGFAAVPGTSNHGLGTALDFCGGVQNQGSPQFNWLRANSLRYGWFHPSWAYSSPFEPWHWEYGTSR